MKLSFSSLVDNDLFVVTDLSCAEAKEFLDSKNLYKIIWCRSEATSIIVDSYKVKLEENEVLFCTPLNVIELDDNQSNLISLVFNKEFFCIQTHDEEVSCNGFLFFGSSEPQKIELKGSDLKSFKLHLDLLVSDFETKDQLQGEMLRALLKRILIHSTRLTKEKLPDPAMPNSQMNIIREYNLLVEKHFRELHHVKDYADLLFKSPKTLSNLFPKYSDKSPLMVINERILLEAKRLLRYSDKSNYEIALELGYKDPSHFSKFFKKHVGATPSEFRNQRSLVA